ncbi:hypothetical protein GH714_029999 [Hevea brasiliensis]|uniref:ACT domain-containing protein ACR n=1 Tax=Hevea brasiliensis TaxID=3981 RepID=A0A6A6KWK1_HEVBR|nr:hypothetical protein GH714_029999 [Hevea brasiliensis]
MDVFHVTDRHGNKLFEDDVAEQIQQSLGPRALSFQSRALSFQSLRQSVGVQSATENTPIELTGRDRPGLLSEVFAVLTDLKCNVVAAEVWTHNSRMASVVYITDEATGLPIDDPDRLTKIKQLLLYVLKETEINEAQIRLYLHVDGSPISSEAERQRVIHCLEAAIRRRNPEGIRLELCGEDRFGLLSEVTRIFRENGLSVTRAEVTTRGSQAVNVFYVTDASGHPVKSETIEIVRKEIGLTILG